MTSKNKKEGTCNCPVGAIFKEIERTIGKKSNFLEHITQSRIEVLKAVRSLVDERIENLGQKKSKTGTEKVKNIQIH